MGVMEMFMAKTVVMISQVSTYLQTHQVVTLNMYNFLYANHTSVEWYKHHRCVEFEFKNLRVTTLLVFW